MIAAFVGLFMKILHMEESNGQGPKKNIAQHPRICARHWLLRLQLAIVFIQQCLSKFPETADDSAIFDLSYLMGWIVVYSVPGAGIGLLGTAFISLKALSHITMISEVSDMLTRFSGIDICWIRPGVV